MRKSYTATGDRVAQEHVNYRNIQALVDDLVELSETVEGIKKELEKSKRPHAAFNEELRAGIRKAKESANHE